MSACGFTTDVLDWSAWIEPVRLEDASADQLAVLEESGPHARGSQYYHLLLHDASALRERSKLFNAIMYGAKGLRRADRELGATVESIENGCIYCTSAHARFYQQLAKKPEGLESVRPAQAVETVFERLQDPKSAALYVTDCDGAIVGLLTRQALAEVILIRSVRPDWRFGKRA